MESKTENKSGSQYTCNEYREEMILLALQHKLQHADSSTERDRIRKEIAKLEETMGF